MNGFVWFTSYLCIFMLGIVFLMTCIWVLTSKDVTNTERKRIENGSNMELPKVPAAPYDFDRPSQN